MMNNEELICELQSIYDNSILGHNAKSHEMLSNLISKLNSSPHGEISSVSKHKKQRNVCVNTRCVSMINNKCYLGVGFCEHRKT